jgi:hypothetical protein
MESLFWGRTDYQDSQYRQSNAGKDTNHWLEWIWRGSASLGSKADVFAGQLTTGGYGSPISYNNQDEQVQDDPRRHDYNVDEQVDAFITAALKLKNNTRGIHQMWPCGSDFEYQNADPWYRNLDKIIHYVNLNASRGGPIKVSLLLLIALTANSFAHLFFFLLFFLFLGHVQHPDSVRHGEEGGRFRLGSERGGERLRRLSPR